MLEIDRAALKPYVLPAHRVPLAGVIPVGPDLDVNKLPARTHAEVTRWKVPLLSFAVLFVVSVPICHWGLPEA